ncbi:MAG TPA: hypothetical protein VEX43_08255 [Chthoniobacterales bacterium]|nr:hypothetical protein [Chthoniobacterales bacterium]
MSRYMIAAALAVAALSTITRGGRAAELAEDVSMVQLIATPEKFDGKFIRVSGFLNLEFEGDSLYLHRDDLFQGLVRNGVWVDRTEAMERERKKLNKHYVMIEGIFSAQHHGHMGLFGGAITNITRVEPSVPEQRHYEDLTHRLPLTPDEQKFVGSWEMSSSTGDRWIETYEPNHTYWIVSYKQGKASLTSKGRWYIMENNRLLVRNPGKTPPREHGIIINDIAENTLKLAQLTYTRCQRPKKPSK